MGDARSSFLAFVRGLKSLFVELDIDCDQDAHLFTIGVLILSSTEGNACGFCLY